MRNLNLKPGLFILLGFSGLVWYSIGTRAGLNMENLIQFMQPLPKVVTADFILIGLFMKWGWRWKIFQRWLVKFPIIQGTWQGTLLTTWKDPQTNTAPLPIPAILVIKQSFESVSCVMHTKESISFSNTASLSEDDESGIKKLSYNYTNRPGASVRDRSAIHDGAAILRIINDPKRKLAGGYWTDRRSTGDMSFTFRSKKLLESFPSDL